MKITYEKLKEANSKLTSINVKGKAYMEVNQRIKAFRMLYPNGCITTDIVSIDNGVCIMTATVKDDEGNVLGTGTAYEKEGSTFINQTSYIENCVPIDTMILTKNGWKYYYQLNIGDEVLSCNLETKNIEYCRLTNINVYKDKEVIELKNSRFSVICTPEHKWITRGQYYPIDKTKTRELKKTQKIVQAIKQEVEGSDLGKKLGWLMCDCDIKTTKNNMPSTAYISQSKYVDEVNNLFGDGILTTNQNENWLPCYEWIIGADEVRKILGYFDISTYKDLAPAMLKADIADVKGCYESMMLADGNSSGFSSTYKELIEAMQIMCVRLGIATTFVTERMCKLSSRPIYTLGIKKTDGAYVSELQTKSLPPRDVWCPTTENGTWFMKQGSFITLTSNCETSAVGRALGMCGIGIETSIASAEEVQNAITNQELNKPAQEAKIKVIQEACKKHRIDSETWLKQLGKTWETLTESDATKMIFALKQKYGDE